MAGLPLSWIAPTPAGLNAGFQMNLLMYVLWRALAQLPSRHAGRRWPGAERISWGSAGPSRFRLGSFGTCVFAGVCLNLHTMTWCHRGPVLSYGHRLSPPSSAAACGGVTSSDLGNHPSGEVWYALGAHPLHTCWWPSRLVLSPSVLAPGS
jgi:hypothetical protein